jgi:hypothetical protein
MKIWLWVCVFVLVGGTAAKVDAVFVNGSFETGDYQGWALAETPKYWEDPATLELWDLRGFGTWGICESGEVLEYNGKLKFDFADSLYNQMYSPGLPKTCSAADGLQHAFQLQDAGQIHLLSQDLDLPSNATAVSWEMMYKNHNQEAPFFRGDQRIRVALKDMNDQLITTLFLTSDTTPQEVAAWTTYAADISQFAGSTVRFEVEVSTFWQRLDAFFDNFRIEVGEVEIPQEPIVEEPPAPPVVNDPAAVPPGWHKNAKTPKGLEKKDQLPKGFGEGRKTGW